MHCIFVAFIAIFVHTNWCFIVVHFCHVIWLLLYNKAVVLFSLCCTFSIIYILCVCLHLILTGGHNQPWTDGSQLLTVRQPSPTLPTRINSISCMQNRCVRFPSPKHTRVNSFERVCIWSHSTEHAYSMQTNKRVITDESRAATIARSFHPAVLVNEDENCNK